MTTPPNRLEEALTAITMISDEVQSGLASVEKFRRSSAVLESTATQVEESLRAMRDASLLLKEGGEKLGKEGVVRFEGLLKSNLEEIQGLMRTVARASDKQAEELGKTADASADVEKHVNVLARQIEGAGKEIADLGRRMTDIREMAAAIKQAQGDAATELKSTKEHITTTVAVESGKLVKSGDAEKRFEKLSEELAIVKKELGAQRTLLEETRQASQREVWIVWGLQALVLALVGFKLIAR